jgi:1,4-dihydroxy-2-naphthoate polyprenyltransferase
VRAWILALRAHFLTATAAPVLVGAAAAFCAAGSFRPWLFLLALAGALLVHLGANMANDYYDWRSETDARNASANTYSGGSRVIQDGLIPARHILAAAAACTAAGALAGLYLAWHLRSLTLLAIGVVGVFFAWFYTGAPLRLGYRGLAEVLNGLSFGPLIVLGMSVVMTGRISLLAVLASLPPGALLAAVLVVNEFPDYESDRAAGKRTVVVIAGQEKAVGVFTALVALPFLWVAALAAAGIFPPWTLLSLASAPLGVRALLLASRHRRDPRLIVGANMSTFFLHLSFSLLFALGLFLGRP